MPQEHQEQLEDSTLLENLPDALVWLDADGRVRRQNAAARRLFPSLKDRVAWEARPDAFSPDYRRAYAERREMHLEMHLADRDEWHEVRVFAAGDGMGVSFRDVTGRRGAEDALRDSEARLQAVFRHASDAVGVAARGVHVFVNPAYAALFGYARPEDVVGLPVLDLIAPGEREAAHARIGRRRAGQEEETVYETRGLRADGTEFETEIHVSVYEQEGEVYSLVLLRDVTERKRAERELRDSEARHRRLTENLGVGIWHVTTDGRTLYCNPAMRAMLEMDTPAEVGARDYHSFFSERSRATMSREHARRPEGAASAYEVEIVGAHGGRRQAVISGAPLFGEDGRLQSLLGTFTDVTPLRRAEEARRQAEEKYRAIFENAREGLFQTSPDGRLLSANPALAQLHGYGSPEEMIAAIRDVERQVYVDPHRRREFLRLIETSDMVTGFEAEMRRRDGSTLWVSENVRAIRDADGTLLHYEGSVVDVTGRKALEAERARLLAEAEERADRDPLTGLRNHHAFHRRLREEAESDGRFAVVAMDLDHFKFFNDAYGHGAGDDVLRQVADALRAHCRTGDALARLGGDEFALLMPGLDRAEAEVVAGRLMGSLADAGFRPLGTGGLIPLRLSVGVAVFPEEGATGEEVLAHADERLLTSKRGGGGGEADELRAAMAGRAGFVLLDALVTATDARDRYTRGHSEQVLALCLRMAPRLGLSEADRETLALAALLHDVGKIGVPDAILRKPGALTEQEYRAVQLHPAMGAAILGATPGFEAVQPVIRHHHERWDGAGYPDGLATEAIPALSRPLAVAEAYASMTTDRAYRQALTQAEALTVIFAGAGTQWDPSAVAALADVLSAGPSTSTVNEPGA